MGLHLRCGWLPRKMVKTAFRSCLTDSGRIVFACRGKILCTAGERLTLYMQGKRCYNVCPIRRDRQDHRDAQILRALYEAWNFTRCQLLRNPSQGVLLLHDFTQPMSYGDAPPMLFFSGRVGRMVYICRFREYSMSQTAYMQSYILPGSWLAHRPLSLGLIRYHRFSSSV
jgi:hypothetical protein